MTCGLSTLHWSGGQAEVQHGPQSSQKLPRDFRVLPGLGALVARVPCTPVIRITCELPPSLSPLPWEMQTVPERAPQCRCEWTFWEPYKVQRKEVKLLCCSQSGAQSPPSPPQSIFSPSKPVCFLSQESLALEVGDFYSVQVLFKYFS